MDILNLLKGQLGEGFMQQISQQVGSDDPKKTEKAATDIVNSTMENLKQQSSTPEGAEQLNKTLEKQAESGGMMQNLTSMFGGNMGNLGGMLSGFGLGGNDNQNQQNNQQTVNGVFGNQQQQTVQNISQSSGLSSDIVSKLMGFLTPIIMGFLGNAKKEQGLDANGVSQLLQQNNQQQNPPQKTGGFLDQNGDGNVGLDDVSGFFKKLF